jgi:hypothetical protein
VVKPVSPIVGWGLGWGISVLTAAVAFAIGDWRAVWGHYPVALVIGTIGFGLPVRLGAQRNGSRYPTVEAVIWVLGFTLAAIVLVDHFVAATQLAKPGDLNINTTETMRQRTEYYSTWHYPPEAVFVFTVLSSFGIGCGFLSAFVAQWPSRGIAQLASATGFAAATGLAVFVGLLLSGLGVSILGPTLSRAPGVPGGLLGVGTALFGAGCAVGAIVESARRALLKP